MKAFSATLALAAALGSPAAAQDLFRVPGNPQLRPADDVSVYLSTTYYGEDATGYLYYGEGYLACHHRDDPATVYSFPEQSFFDANGTRVRGDTFGQITPDGTGLYLAYVPLYPYWQPLHQQEAVRIFRTSCAEMIAIATSGGEVTPLGGTRMRTDDPLLEHIGRPAFQLNADGELCFTASETPGLPPEGPASFGIVCIDPATTPATYRHFVDAESLDEALDVEPEFAKGDGKHVVFNDGWMFHAPSTAPGGRFFFLADRFWISVGARGTTPITRTLRYVVERAPDGTLLNRLGPVDADAGWSVLNGISRFIYSVELDAMVGLVLGQEHNWDSQFNGEFLQGWGGIGLRVIPLDAPGGGYLPLSRIVLARHGCQEQYAVFCNQLARTTVHAARDGGLLISIYRVNPDNPNAQDFDFYHLELDPATLDLDDDGLDATTEAAAGTWDTVSDSDYGGTPDNVELRLAASDPLSTAGEPARQAGVPSELRYVPSPLIQKHLADLSGNAIRLERPVTIGNDNPVCAGGDCYGPDGFVARYPLERWIGGTRTVIAADGSFIMLRTAEGLVRFYFEDGREELAVPEATLNIYVPTWTPGVLHVIPIDADRTLLAVDGQEEGEQYPALVALAEGDAVTVIYDQLQAVRDSGYTPPTDAVATWFQVIGWNADTERLHLGVRGLWESWHIALGLDGSTVLLGRGRALTGLNQDFANGVPTLQSLFPPPMPDYLLPTGHGEYFASGSVMEPFGSYLPVRTTLLSNMPMAPLAFWGDVLLDTVCCGYNGEVFPYGLRDGLYELLRYDQRVAPGDLLIAKMEVRFDVEGMMLYRSGPRGGRAELWPAPAPEIRDIAAIDLEPARMHLCVADRGSDVLWELEPAGPDAPPELVRYAADVPGIIDCAYEPDGTLIALATGPARVMARTGAFDELGVRDTLPAAPAPLELLRRPDGTHEVRVKDGLRGKLYLPDGRVVSMREDDMAVRIDDAVVADFGERFVYQSATIDYGSKHPARAAFALRPDGGIVVAPFDGELRPPYALGGQISLIEVGGYQGPLVTGYDDGGNGIGLAVVPGGSRADPWTGRLPPGIEPPGAPELPRSFAPAADEPPSDEGGGCAGGSLPNLLPALIWALLARLASRGLRYGAALRAALFSRRRP